MHNHAADNAQFLVEFLHSHFWKNQFAPKTRGRWITVNNNSAKLITTHKPENLTRTSNFMAAVMEACEAYALRYGEKLSLCKTPYLAASCITVINYLLDRKTERETCI
jgi:hypothetical protein